jgi:putative flippase GtrA
MTVSALSHRELIPPSPPRRGFHSKLEKNAILRGCSELTMADVLRGWHPDPFGVHELRYFTFDGNATRLVRNGDAWAHDVPPSSPLSVLERKGALRLLESPWDGRDSGVGFYGEPPNSHEVPAGTRIAPQPVAHQMSVVEAIPGPVAAVSSRRSTIARLLRYCSVSVFSTVMGLTLLGVMVGVFGWNATWSNVLTTAIGVVPAFELSRRWVWVHDGKRSVLRQAVPYAAISFAGLIVSTIAVHLAAEATSTSTRLVHTAAVELANLGGYGALWVVQFVVCDRILFRGRGKAVEAPDSNGLLSHDLAGGAFEGPPRQLVSSQVVA